MRDRRKILLGLPESMLEDADTVAYIENRSRSELIREALRQYLDAFKRNYTPGVQHASDRLRTNFPEAHRKGSLTRRLPLGSLLDKEMFGATS